MVISTTDKSPGPDQLHPRILYETRDVIAYPLFLIFKKSLDTVSYTHLTLPTILRV